MIRGYSEVLVMIVLVLLGIKLINNTNIKLGEVMLLNEEGYSVILVVMIKLNLYSA